MCSAAIIVITVELVELGIREGLLEHFKNRLALLFSLILEDLSFVALLEQELNLEGSLGKWGFGLDNVVVIAMRAEFIGLLVFFDLFSEDLLTFLACEDELHGLHELALSLPEVFVAVWAVEPLLATWGSDRDLGVHNMLAHLSV